MAVVVNGKTLHKVIGDVRMIILTNVAIAADTDAYKTGLNTVLAVVPVSNTNNAVGFTLSGTQVVFQTGGAETLSSCLIIGT